MTRQLVLVVAMAMLLMIEFAPGCHGKSVSEENEEDANVVQRARWLVPSLTNEEQGAEGEGDVETAKEEEAEDAETNADNEEELWSLAERVADLVNERQKVGIQKTVKSPPKCLTQSNAMNGCLASKAGTIAQKTAKCQPERKAFFNCLFAKQG